MSRGKAFSTRVRDQFDTMDLVVDARAGTSVLVGRFRGYSLSKVEGGYSRTEPSGTFTYAPGTEPDGRDASVTAVGDGVPAAGERVLMLHGLLIEAMSECGLIPDGPPPGTLAGNGT